MIQLLFLAVSIAAITAAGCTAHKPAVKPRRPSGVRQQPTTKRLRGPLLMIASGKTLRRYTLEVASGTLHAQPAIAMPEEIHSAAWLDRQRVAVLLDDGSVWVVTNATKKRKLAVPAAKAWRVNAKPAGKKVEANDFPSDTKLGGLHVSAMTRLVATSNKQLFLTHCHWIRSADLSTTCTESEGRTVRLLPSVKWVSSEPEARPLRSKFVASKPRVRVRLSAEKKDADHRLACTSGVDKRVVELTAPMEVGGNLEFGIDTTWVSDSLAVLGLHWLDLDASADSHYREITEHASYRPCAAKLTSLLYVAMGPGRFWIALGTDTKWSVHFGDKRILRADAVGAWFYP